MPERPCLLLPTLTIAKSPEPATCNPREAQGGYVHLLWRSRSMSASDHLLLAILAQRRPARPVHGAGALQAQQMDQQKAPGRPHRTSQGCERSRRGGDTGQTQYFWSCRGPWKTFRSAVLLHNPILWKEIPTRKGKGLFGEAIAQQQQPDTLPTTKAVLPTSKMCDKDAGRGHYS